MNSELRDFLENMPIEGISSLDWFAIQFAIQSKRCRELTPKMAYTVFGVSRAYFSQRLNIWRKKLNVPLDPLYGTKLREIGRKARFENVAPIEEKAEFVKSLTGKRYARAEECAKYLSISRRTLENWKNNGTLPSLKIKGKLVLFDLDMVDAALARFARKIEKQGDQ